MKNTSGSKTSIYTFIVLAMILIAGSQIQASDLKFGKARINTYIEYGSSLPIEVEVLNDSNFTADSYKVFVDIKNSSAQTVFSSTINASTLLPYETAILSTNALWTPELRGKYTINLEIDFQYEVLPEDNKTQQAVTVGSSREQVRQLFINDIYANLKYDLGDSWSFLTQAPLQPGDILASEDSTEYCRDLNSYKWFVWLDLKRDFRFAHPGLFITIDALDDTATIDETSWPPQINDQPWLGDFNERRETIDRITGVPPTEVVTTDTSTISETAQSTNSTDSTCALLFVGKIKSDYEREAFGNDVDFMAQNLRKEKLGPRLPESQVQTTKNATAQEICDALDAAKDQYSKLYFYYTGHGAKFWLGTNDDIDHKLRYQDLANKLYATNAKDICVIIDACHAGGLEFWMRIHDDYHTRNVTLLMSSHEDSSSYSRTIHTDGNGNEIDSGAFTWALVKCWGDPAADSDGVEGISLKEAFDWVRQVNPALRNGRMNDKMDPQMLIHRVEKKPATRTFRIPDTDVQVTQNDPPLQDGAEIHVELDNVDKFEYSDDNIIHIYPQKKWRIGLENQVLDYNLDLQFGYEYAIPLGDTSQGQVGAVQRQADSSWQSIVAQYQIDSKSVLAANLKLPGEWAVALVNSDGVSAVNSAAEVPERFALMQNYPNPFNPQTTIAFQLPRPDFVKLVIYDINGRRLRSLINREMAAGMHRIVFDAAELSSGFYFYKLQAGGHSEMRKMLLLH